jgi:hypothetical protein
MKVPTSDAISAASSRRKIGVRNGRHSVGGSCLGDTGTELSYWIYEGIATVLFAPDPALQPQLQQRNPVEHKREGLYAFLTAPGVR